MKNIYCRISNLLLYHICTTLFSTSLYAQTSWPVTITPPEFQGTVTGTIGEYRETKNEKTKVVINRRLHAGIDLIGSNGNRNVVVIQGGTVSVIEKGKSWFRDHVLVTGNVGGNIEYRHITAKQGLKVGDKVKVGDIIGTMRTGGAIHVHMANEKRDNFLEYGFGIEGFNYIDKIKPIIANIYFHKGDHNHLTTDNDEFTTLVSIPQEPIPAKLVYGKVDIVANAWDPRTSGTGGLARPDGKTAPYYFGYKVFDEQDRSVKDFSVTIGFERWPTDGPLTTRNAYAAILHARRSSTANPYWIVTNRLPLDGKVADGYWDTSEQNDGLYKVEVAVEDVKENGAEKTANVYINNFKEYIKDVKVWTVGSNELVYDAGWTLNKTSGIIEFSKRIDKVVPGASNLRIQAITSERIKSLGLEFNKSTYPSRKNFEGSIWEFQVPIPTSPTPLEQLSFVGSTLESNSLLSLGPNDTQALVGRDQDGNFPGGNQSLGKDTRHSIQFCSSSNTTVDFSIDIKSNTTVYINATGGEIPYQYSIDNKPFGSDPTFSGLKTGQQYNFAVKDKNGCKKEKQFVMQNADCNTASSSGGQGTFNQVHQLGKSSGTVTVSWQMYTIPDQLNLIYNGQVVATTGRLVGGTGSRTFNYNPKPGEPDFCIVQMVAPNNGTLWNYTIECPSGVDNNLRLANEEPLYTIHYSTQNNKSSLMLRPTNDDDTNYYLLHYRYKNEESWNEVKNIRLPYELTNLEAGRELDTELLVIDALKGQSEALELFPNPNTGTFTVRFSSDVTKAALVKVVDLHGKAIYTQIYGASKGINNIPITLPNSTSGLLILLVQQGDVIRSSKFSKVQ